MPEYLPKTHLSGKPCGLWSIYPLPETDKIENVTCKSCIKQDTDKREKMRILKEHIERNGFEAVVSE